MKRRACNVLVASTLLFLAIGCGASVSPTAPTPPIDQTVPFFLAVGASVGTGAAAGTSVINVKVQRVTGAPSVGATVAFTTDVGTLSSASATTAQDGTASVTLTNKDTATVNTKVGTLSSKLLVVSEPQPNAPPAPTPPVLPPPPPPPPPPLPPVPSYNVTVTASPNSLSANGTSALTASAVPVNGAPAATSFDWDCTGSGTSTTTGSATTICAYPTGGTFTARVVARGGTASGVGTTTVTVIATKLTITVNCVPAAHATPTSCNLSAVDETGANATVTIASTIWDFGDGPPPLPPAFPGVLTQHTFVQPGIFIVQATATSSGGRVGISTATITIPQ